jgi:hypothetical protein
VKDFAIVGKAAQMGWVSYSEDIAELRSERDHMLKGLDALIERATDPESDLPRIDAEVAGVAKKLVDYLQRKRAEAELLFEEAERFMSDRHVQSSKALRKKTDQLSDARKRLAVAEDKLVQCRTSQTKLQRQNQDVAKENRELKLKLESFERKELVQQRNKEDRLAWERETKNVEKKPKQL